MEGMKKETPTFSEYLESMKTNKVEITEDDFANAVAEVMASEPFDSFIKENPHLIVLFGMFTAKINRAIFHKDIDESED